MVFRMTGVAPASRTDFVVKYLENLVSPHRNKETREWLYTYFRNIGNWCKKNFCSPFNLAVLILLSVYDPAMMSHLTTGTAFFAQLEKFRILRLVNHLTSRPEYAHLSPEELRFLCSGFIKLLNDLAFESLQLGETTLAPSAMTRLAEKCRRLGLPAETMFSAFLKCQLSAGNRSYSFGEKSIQEFRAACHLCFLATYQPVLGSDSSQSSAGSPFHDVVFFTAGLLAEKLSHALAENTEFIIQQAVGAGIKETSEWLDLLQEALCHEVLAEAVGRSALRKDRWDVKEVHLPALRTLLLVASPKSLHVTVNSLERPPEEIPVLCEVLRRVAGQPVSISLSLNYYFVMGRSRNADNLLRLLLQGSAVITGFVGYLSSSMISQLPSTLHTLALQVDRRELETLASVLPKMKHLERLEIFLRVDNSTQKLPCLDFHQRELIVDFCKIRDESTAWVTRALSSLSRRPFARVKLFHSFLTARGALALLAALRAAKVSFAAGGLLEVRSCHAPSEDERRQLRGLPVAFRIQ
ncbi:uncharacterized protein LOC119587041 [Penaeus monodon]|uniref:uncharacterized protein LOC119587041 n=1 Tax=Penaeus monodon TaxID=6687 RepID=UPI0018A6DB42|nr:uncharacterized protein LOC119587041 [Penaeus monodon]